MIRHDKILIFSFSIILGDVAPFVDEIDINRAYKHALVCGKSIRAEILDVLVEGLD